MFSNEAIEKNYPDFFKTYPVNVGNTKLRDTMEKSWKIKEKVRKLFPLDFEGRVLIAEYEQGTSGESIDMGFEKTITAIYSVCAYLNIQAGGNHIRTNMYPSKSGMTKLSRTILAAIAEKPLDATMAAHISLQDLCTELPLLPITGKSDVALIIQNFYSEVARMKDSKLRMELSFNPYDILNASTGRVSSCNKIGGQYEAAPLAAAMSPRMAILRILMPNGILLGRQYVCFGEDGLSATFQPLYGQMSSTHCQDFRTWMTAYFKYRKPPAADVTWRVCFERITMPTEAMSCVRNSTFYVDSTYATFWRTDSPTLPELVVGETFCLVCGNPTCRGTLLCEKCRGSLFQYCKFCRKIMSKSDKVMCDACATTTAECKLCGKAHRIENGLNGVCSNCNPGHSYCIMCGVYDIQRNMLPIIEHSAYIHQDCLKSTAKCWCGATKNKHSTHCLTCTIKFQFLNSVQHSLDKIGSVFRTLKSYGKPEVEPKVTPTRIKFGWSEDKAA